MDAAHHAKRDGILAAIAALNDTAPRRKAKRVDGRKAPLALKPDAHACLARHDAGVGGAQGLILGADRVAVEGEVDDSTIGKLRGQRHRAGVQLTDRARGSHGIRIVGGCHGGRRRSHLSRG